MSKMFVLALLIVLVLHILVVVGQQRPILPFVDHMRPTAQEIRPGSAQVFVNGMPIGVSRRGANAALARAALW